VCMIGLIANQNQNRFNNNVFFFDAISQYSLPFDITNSAFGLIRPS
jgi:hypothetical protein